MILKNKTALITGCQGGIGFALLKKFSENGSNIICCARKKTNDFENTINEIKKKHKNQIYPVYFDLTNEMKLKKELKK